MRNKRKCINILLTIVIMIVFPIVSICENNKEYFLNYNQNKVSLENFSQICITPGENETMLNFSWYSKFSDGVSKIKLCEKDGKEVIYKGESINLENGFISNKVTVKNLKENTTYFYSYEYDGVWSKPIEYKTKSFKNYTFLFMSDPQIGASSRNMNSHEDGISRDSHNWSKVIKKALNKSPNANFIVCAGDETNEKEDKDDSSKTDISNLEYSGFLAPSYLRYIPIANAIGNHDKDNENFYNHFNIPNLNTLGQTIAGGDYYFIYGNALYLFINTNNLDINEHKKFIEEANYENKNIKWRIAVFHHDIYGGGVHKEDEDIKILKKCLPGILEDNNIDLVLCGHDHIYSRTYPLKDNQVIDLSEERVKNSKEKIDIIKNNKGITYITGSSCTGSKFYKQKTKEKDKYIRKTYCEKIPTYTVIDINQNSIEIMTYEIDENKPIDNKIIIQK